MEIRLLQKTTAPNSTVTPLKYGKVKQKFKGCFFFTETQLPLARYTKRNKNKNSERKEEEVLEKKLRETERQENCKIPKQSFRRTDIVFLHYEGFHDRRCVR